MMQHNNLSHIILPENNHRNHTHPALLIGIKRQNYNGNWFQTRKALSAQGVGMLSLPLFIEFLTHLQIGPVYNQNGIKIPSVHSQEILTSILQEHAMEWLDASFETKNQDLFVTYPTFNTDSTYTPIQEPLEQHLNYEQMLQQHLTHFNLSSLLNHPTRLGFPSTHTQTPTPSTTNIEYEPPRPQRVITFGIPDKYCGNATQHHLEKPSTQSPLLNCSAIPNIPSHNRKARIMQLYQLGGN